MSNNNIIKYSPRNTIDEKKYDACISKAVQNGTYAFSWYLDITCDNWGALILNDYEAVMPLPFRKKYFINYIYTPYFTQQLGIFSIKKIELSLLSNFIDAIPPKFRSITNNFNSGNKLNSELITIKKNYILDLNQGYDELYKNYRRDRKTRLKQVKKKNLIIKNCSPELLIETFKKEKSKELELKNKDYTRLSYLIYYCVKNGKGSVLGVFENDIFLGGSFFFHSNQRIIYLFSTATQKGRKLNVATLLIDDIIKRTSDTPVYFDFEGSMIPGIASFFKSFGAKTEDYYLFHKKFNLF